MTAKLRNAKELTRNLRGQSWISSAMGTFLDKWRFSVERGAKANTKRDESSWLWKGHVRRSLTSARDESAFPTWARVGSNLPAARWGEFGTGTLSEDPQSSHKRHWPPAAALEPWARAHGTTGFVVARAIGLRGGIEPRRFLRDAADDAEAKIPGWLSQASRDIETAVRHGA